MIPALRGGLPAPRKRSRRSKSRAAPSSDGLTPRQRIWAILDALDADLAPHGHRELSPAWRECLQRWLLSSKRTLVLRKGRRIGASTIVAPRLIVAWCLVVPPRLRLPPGETVEVAIVSIIRGEASNRIAQIAAVLRALRIEHEAIGERIRIPSLRVLIRVYTRSWRSAVGPTIGLLWCDEVSRWESGDASANPAAEVMASVKPALAAIPDALIVLASSPWSVDDYHATQYDRGETDEQCVAFLPTWVARPELTEEETHRLEPDARIWSREYAAVPGHTVSSALDADDVRAAFGTVLPTDVHERWLAIDASSLRGDAFAWALGHRSRRGLVIDEVGGWEDRDMQDQTYEGIVASLAERARAAGVRTVWGDQREGRGLESLFARRGLTFVAYDWTLPSKHDAMLALRRLLRDRRIQICEHATLAEQMRTCKARLNPSGVVSYDLHGRDYLSCIVTALHAYQRDYPARMAEMLSGGELSAPESDSERTQRVAREQAQRYRREAQKRVARRRGI
jgi:hypothetical protein